ncbi:MAG: flagellar basal body rod protein FlgC [Lentisphaeria bacterium]|nr:flagellar basal body rod protein FlgC [Lentisphaeria bacterium]NQZ69370.1 flagellar basal body rod protein FlgC [Lentisphaeria bacterium]
MDLMPGMAISASGLEAERIRMEVASHNLANTQTTKDVNGGAYQRRQVVFAEKLSESINGSSLNGVEVSDVIRDQRAAIERYQPWHPDSDENGFVKYPDISAIEEMLDIMTATRAYEANLTAMKQSKQMVEQTISRLG